MEPTEFVIAMAIITAIMLVLALHFPVAMLAVVLAMLAPRSMPEALAMPMLVVVLEPMVIIIMVALAFA